MTNRLYHFSYYLVLTCLELSLMLLEANLVASITNRVKLGGHTNGLPSSKNEAVCGPSYIHMGLPQLRLVMI
ncbi:hypothetical protein F5X96DRAFT_664844 [Biscogniauxia mediterranea]|nr:hypothetical protein F5X96DRAFT_664844 [Biscogniauxia mediterranea]